MTVKELIKRLEREPPNALVTVERNSSVIPTFWSVDGCASDLELRASDMNSGYFYNYDGDVDAPACRIEAICLR